MKKLMGRYEGEKRTCLIICKNLLLAYLFTLIMLLFTALLLYKAGISEKAVSVMMIILYMGSCFLGGFATGKQLKIRRFLWGMIVGAGYFIILVFLSWIVGRKGVIFTRDTFTTMFLCIGGGMLGGMLS